MPTLVVKAAADASGQTISHGLVRMLSKLAAHAERIFDVGYTRLADRLWLKATLLNPHTRPEDLDRLLKLVEGTPPR